MPDDNTVTQIGNLAEFINRYGFTFVFAAVFLFAIIAVIILFIKRWDQNAKARLDIERNKSQVELDIMKEQRKAELEQTSKMFDLVTNVQTAQVSQLEAISKNLNLIMSEIKDSHSTVYESITLLSNITVQLTALQAKFDSMNEQTTNIQKEVDNHDHEVEEHIKDMFVLLREIREHIKD